MNGTTLIRITASDPDPQRAADIANATAKHFSRFRDSAVAPTFERISGSDHQQLADLKGQIDHLAISKTAISSRVRIHLTPRLKRNWIFENHAQPDAGLYAQTLLTAQTMDLNTAATRTQVTVFENAVAPNAPYAPRVALWVLIGGSRVYACRRAVMLLSISITPPKRRAISPPLWVLPYWRRSASYPNCEMDLTRSTC